MKPLVPGEDGFDPDLPQHWTPAAQEKFLEQMRTGGTPQAFYCKSPGRRCDGAPHDGYDYEHARGDQWPPPFSDPTWAYWVLRGGRGSGKTKSGAEFVRNLTRYTGRIALIAPTAADLRDVMIEGDSGILRCCELAGFLPVFEPSKRRVTFPNGAVAYGYSAEEPDRLRGPQHGGGWLDEPAHWPNVDYVWDMYSYGLRLGDVPRTAITTTPTPIPWLRDLLAEPETRAVQVSTFANARNLAPKYLERMKKRYAGTRQGRQELEGELLEDVEGALWSLALIEDTRVDVAQAPLLRRIVVGVDPAGTSTKRSDLTGIVVLGVGYDDELYVVADYSGRYTPHEWATKVMWAYGEHQADLICAEKNYGGEMVEHVLRTELGTFARVEKVNSRRGKLIRAEPVFSLFEQHRAHLVGTQMGDLEDQLCAWVPGSTSSPDRLDALVHGAWALGITPQRPAGVSRPKGRINRVAIRLPGRKAMKAIEPTLGPVKEIPTVKVGRKVGRLADR